MDRSDWPRESRLLCWHCAYGFDTVPAYLPQVDLPSSHHYRLRGNFCSWNCVKSYFFYECRFDRRKSDSSLQAIALLAFLTSHRPNFCPSLLKDHTPTCPCLEVWKGIMLAPPRHEFIHFGGTLDIHAYRKTAMTITSVHMLSYRLQPHISRQLETTPQRRMLTYSFVRDRDMFGQKNQKEDIEQSKPDLYRYRNQWKQTSLL